MKRGLRKQMQGILAAMTPEVVADKSCRACEKLIALEEFRRANVVMLYLPIPTEVDVTAAALVAWRDGKTVVAPKVNWERPHMTPVAIDSMDRDVVLVKYGIREPRNNWAHPLEEIDLVIVPALAFDHVGGRLGRGGGFYDRFLAQEELNVTACGLAFEQQIVDMLPTEGHDHEVDLVVTDQRVLRFNPTGSEPGRGRTGQ